MWIRHMIHVTRIADVTSVDIYDCDDPYQMRRFRDFVQGCFLDNHDTVLRYDGDVCVHRVTLSSHGPRMTVSTHDISNGFLRNGTVHGPTRDMDLYPSSTMKAHLRANPFQTSYVIYVFSNNTLYLLRGHSKIMSCEGCSNMCRSEDGHAYCGVTLAWLGDEGNPYCPNSRRSEIRRASVRSVRVAGSG